MNLALGKMTEREGNTRESPTRLKGLVFENSVGCIFSHIRASISASSVANTRNSMRCGATEQCSAQGGHGGAQGGHAEAQGGHLEAQRGDLEAQGGHAGLRKVN